ncbi:MAG: methyltransferase domain-containing protein [Endomicrobiales bacterium]|nr:methyltransferase domain-containing protein [Endomicrobiales bacterium]
MIKKNSRRLYNDLSWIWPIISPPDEYIEETNLFAKIINKHAKIKVKTLLHLGCGGGHNDYTFKKHFKVTGIDISQNMLKLAKKLNPKSEYIKGDMRNISLNRQFDAIVTGDSIAYARTRKDLKKVFKTAFEHLKPGGVFLTIPEFTKENFEQNKTECITHPKKNIEITYIETLLDPNRADSTFEANYIFLIKKNGKLKMYTDNHIGGLFSTKTWESSLRNTGFRIKKIKFTHSSFKKGYFLPMYVCFKND